MEYDKPFKTYREQIDILKNRYGLIIEDEDFAEAALKSLTMILLMVTKIVSWKKNGLLKE